MGRSVTPPYRLEMSGVTAATWRVKAQYGIPGDGKPTEANLIKYIRAYAKSLESGSNVHISKALGYVPYPTWARIVRQADGQVMAEWKAAPFQVWD